MSRRDDEWILLDGDSFPDVFTMSSGVLFNQVVIRLSRFECSVHEDQHVLLIMDRQLDTEVGYHALERSMDNQNEPRSSR